MVVFCNSTILVSIPVPLNNCFNFFGVVPNAPGLPSLTYPIFSSILFSDCYNFSSYLSPSFHLPEIIFHYFLWLMFIPFFIYIKTNFPTYFPIYCSAHPVMPPFIPPLCQHRTFTHVSMSHPFYHTIYTCFFSLSLVYFCLYCVCPNSLFLCCHN